MSNDNFTATSQHDGIEYTARPDGTVEGQSGEVWHPNAETRAALDLIKDPSERSRLAWRIAQDHPMRGTWRS